MASTWRICVCLCCCLSWLSGGSADPPGFLAAPEDAASPLGAVLSQSRVLPPLLKVLHGSRGWQGELPRLQPDSRALRYMKRLYRLSAGRDGIPKARRGRLYNTVRLFSPGWECGHGHLGTGTSGLGSSGFLCAGTEIKIPPFFRAAAILVLEALLLNCGSFS